MKSDGRRLLRAEKEVQQCVASYLISGFKIPMDVMITVSRLKMSSDLKSAKVYVSMLWPNREALKASSMLNARDDENTEKVIELLQRRKGEIQDHIHSQLKMRFCPKLTFFLDESTEKIIKIEKILEEIKPK